MYFKVAVLDGVLDIDYNDLAEAHVLSITEAVVRLHETEEIRDAWVEITEEEFKNYAPPIIVSGSPIDQQRAALDAIMSGQIDTATQSANANDAIMNAMIDIQAQLDEIKTKLGVV